MEKLKVKIDRHRRQLDDLVLELVAKMNVAHERFDFKLEGQFEKASEAVQKANAELFYAQVALGL